MVITAKESYYVYRFEIYVTGKDDTDSIRIKLEDREVRTIIVKSVYELINEVENKNYKLLLQ